VEKCIAARDAALVAEAQADLYYELQSCIRTRINVDAATIAAKDVLQEVFQICQRDPHYRERIVAQARLQAMQDVEKVFMYHDGIPNLRNYLKSELARLAAADAEKEAR